MSLPTDTIAVTKETAELLRAKATAHHLSLDAYLRALVETDVGPEPAPQATLEEFDRDMDALTARLEGLSVLPRDFSRADIYADSD
jgi:hypothetical protein